MTFFRAIFAELVSPFFLTLGVTSFVLMMGKIYNLISLMVEKRMEMSEAARMFLYLLPQSVTFTIPVAVLGAVTIVVLRHSSESELMAMRAAGQSLWRYGVPFVAFGVLGTVVTAVMTLWVNPTANRRFLDFQVEVIRAHAEDTLKPGELNFDFGDKVIRIGERLPDREVRRVFLADRELSPGSPVVLADRGRIAVDEENRQVVFRLRDGEMYSEDAGPAGFTTATFDRLSYVLELSGSGKVDTIEVELTWTHPNAGLIQRANAPGASARERTRMLTELFTRLTVPWASLAYALAAIPIAMVRPRSGRGGTILRATGLVLAYYILWIGCQDLIYTGHAPPWLLAVPPLAILLYGAVRLGRANALAGT